MAIKFITLDDQIEVDHSSICALTQISVGHWFNNVGVVEKFSFRDTGSKIIGIRLNTGYTDIWSYVCGVATDEGEILVRNPGYSSGWNYVQVTYDGEYVRMYMNSVEQFHTGGGSFDELPAPLTGTVISGDTITLGGPISAPDALTLYDVRIYERALSQEEIDCIYESRGSDSIVNGLVARWLMNEGTDGAVAAGANSIIDISGNNNNGTPVNSPIYRAAPMTLTRPTVSYLEEDVFGVMINRYNRIQSKGIWSY